MARERFCKICRLWHDLDQSWPEACWPDRARLRSNLAAPMIIGDTMAPVKSMLDGKIYDSKAALRATYRRAGVTEVGNDAPRTPKPKRGPDMKGVKTSVGRAFSQAGLGV